MLIVKVLVRLRLLLLHDDRRRLLPHDDSRGLLLLRRVDGPLVAGRDEWDPRTGPAAADAQKRGNRDGGDADEFLLMRPGMLRLLDHDGGRLHGRLLVDHLPHGLHGLLLVHDLSHGLLHGLHDRNGRGLHDHGGLRLDDGAHGRLLCHGGGLGARDVARGHGFALALHGRRRQGCPSKREVGRRETRCAGTPGVVGVAGKSQPRTETELSKMRAYLWFHICPGDVYGGHKDSAFLLVSYRPLALSPSQRRGSYGA
jgi:hypothetical protein